MNVSRIKLSKIGKLSMSRSQFYRWHCAIGARWLHYLGALGLKVTAVRPCSNSWKSHEPDSAQRSMLGAVLLAVCCG